MLCAICRREARGFGFSPRMARLQGLDLALCSMLCLNTAKRFKGMIDPNEHEAAALCHASKTAGQYVESLGSTDLAFWTEQEWATLVDLIVTAFQDHLRQAYQDHPTPF